MDLRESLTTVTFWIPPALAANLDFGLDLVDQPRRPKGIGPKLANGITTGKHRSRWMVIELWTKLVMWRLGEFLRNVWREQTERTEDFVSGDEHTARTMCITAFGHAQYEGRFRLGKRGEETALRLDCVNGRSLAEDPIYQQIGESIAHDLGARVAGGRQDHRGELSRTMTLAMGLKRPALACTVSPPASGPVSCILTWPCYSRLIRSISVFSDNGKKCTRQRPGSLGIRAAAHRNEFFQ